MQDSDKIKKTVFLSKKATEVIESLSERAGRSWTQEASFILESAIKAGQFENESMQI